LCLQILNNHQVKSSPAKQLFSLPRAYLHALTDLRAARAQLQHQDGGALQEEEKEAIHQIDEAIDEIKRASIDDGKDLDNHPAVDAGMDHAGRLHRAKQLLEKAHQDIAHEEDNSLAQGLHHP
jgi:hypothetical protein